MIHGSHAVGWCYTVIFFISATTVCVSDTEALSVGHEENSLTQDVLGSQGDSSSSPEVTHVLHQMLQILQERDQHTQLYERVAVLEGKLREKSEDEIRFKTEFVELKAKIPIMEEQITNLTILREKSDMFEIKMEKLVHRYEEKLSTLASEIIRLKKNEARFKDLQALRDQAGNSVRLRSEVDLEDCPSIGVDLDAVRVGGECLYMAWRSSFNWSAAHGHCQALGGDLAAPQDLLPLKTFLHSTFARGPSLWLGTSYDEYISSASSTTQRSPSYQQHQRSNNRPDPRKAALMLHQLNEEDQKVRDQGGGGDHNAQRPNNMILHDMMSMFRNDEMQSDDGNMDAPNELLDADNSLGRKIETGGGNLETETYIPEDRNQNIMDLHTEHRSDSITPIIVQRAPEPESESSPSKIRCLLLWLNQALEYELVGRPCNEQHYFVCQIHKQRKQEPPFEMDSLLQEQGS